MRKTTSTTFLKDPVNDRALVDPVVIIHPEIAPIIYNRETVVNAVTQRELIQFGIKLNNYKNFIQPDTMTQSLIEIMAKNKDMKVSYAQLLKSYQCPISLEYPFPHSIFLVSDGQVYDAHSLYSAIKTSLRSPINRSQIHQNDLLIHPFYGQLVEYIHEHKLAEEANREKEFSLETAIKKIYATEIKILRLNIEPSPIDSLKKLLQRKINTYNLMLAIGYIATLVFNQSYLHILNRTASLDTLNFATQILLTLSGFVFYSTNLLFLIDRIILRFNHFDASIASIAIGLPNFIFDRVSQTFMKQDNGWGSSFGYWLITHPIGYVYTYLPLLSEIEKIYFYKQIRKALSTNLIQTLALLSVLAIIVFTQLNPSSILNLRITRPTLFIMQASVVVRASIALINQGKILLNFQNEHQPSYLQFIQLNTAFFALSLGILHYLKSNSLTESISEVLSIFAMSALSNEAIHKRPIHIPDQTNRYTLCGIKEQPRYKVETIDRETIESEYTI